MYVTEPNGHVEALAGQNGGVANAGCRSTMLPEGVVLFTTTSADVRVCQPNTGTASSGAMASATDMLPLARTCREVFTAVDVTVHSCTLMKPGPSTAAADTSAHAPQDDVTPGVAVTSTDTSAPAKATSGSKCNVSSATSNTPSSMTTTAVSSKLSPGTTAGSVFLPDCTSTSKVGGRTVNAGTVTRGRVTLRLYCATSAVLKDTTGASWTVRPSCPGNTRYVQVTVTASPASSCGKDTSTDGESSAAELASAPVADVAVTSTTSTPAVATAASDNDTLNAVLLLLALATTTCRRTVSHVPRSAVSGRSTSCTDTAGRPTVRSTMTGGTRACALDSVAFTTATSPDCTAACVDTRNMTATSTVWSSPEAVLVTVPRGTVTDPAASSVVAPAATASHSPMLDATLESTGVTCTDKNSKSCGIGAVTASTAFVAVPAGTPTAYTTTTR